MYHVFPRYKPHLFEARRADDGAVALRVEEGVLALLDIFAELLFRTNMPEII